MIYVNVDGDTGRILASCTRNIFGGDAREIPIMTDGMQLVEDWYFSGDDLLPRPSLGLDQEIEVDYPAIIDIGSGGSVVCLGGEFFDSGEGALIETAVPSSRFDAVLIPPFPYKRKVISVVVRASS
jgi:hypothetical protein